MLPRCRTVGEPFVIPAFDVQVSDVEGFMDELQAFQRVFHDCFARSEARAHCVDYMGGQYSPLARKSIEPMALAVEGSRVRSLQRFLSESVWDEEQMRWNYHHLVADELGEPDGVRMFDASGFVKKGNDSAGVARQYCGTRGKVENCQVGVCAGYASRQGYGLVDQRLFLPAVWLSPAYASRREQCRVPEELRLQTKPQLAAAMLQCIRQEEILPFRYIVADSVYGNSPAFLAAIEACVGATAVVALSSETRCWLQRPATQEQAYRSKGEERAKGHLRPTASAPQSVAALAATLPAWQGYRRTVSEGTTGPIEHDFARHRVTLCQDGLPERTVWLVIKRPRGPEPTYAYALSNAPASGPFRTLVWLSGIRWAVEPCFEEGKTALGMAHDAGRQYAGWHHHMLLTMLAHFFLWPLQGRLGEKSASTHSVAAAPAIPSRVAPAYRYD
jgi:SRSO17 transposase